ETPGDFNLEGLVQDSSADVGLRVVFAEPGENGMNREPAAQVQIFHNEESLFSRNAADFVAERLDAANIAWIRQWAESSAADFRVPIEKKRVVLAPEETGSAVLGILPLILLLMTVTGGVYPAIDLTAGERERNTLETLMALPVPKFRLLLAKFVAVVTVTMLTGVMNLIAMSVTLYVLQLDKTLLGGDGFTLVLAFKLFVVLAAFTLFYSAILLLLTSSAKSFKEAQAYLIPLLLISIAPGLVIMMPGWGLSSFTAALPLVNMLLLSKGLLEGTAELLPAIVAIITTVFYAIAALSLAAQVFGNDAVAVGSRGRWRDFFERPDAGLTRPTTTAALIGLAVLFPAYFVASGVLGRGGEVDPQNRLYLSGLLTAALFVGLPSLFLLWQRVPVGMGLGIRPARVVFFVAAVLLGVSTWPWIFELIILAQSIGLRGVDLSRVPDVEALLASWKEVPLWLTLLALGVIPGVCEECFFRGYVLGGLRQHLSPRAAIICSAIAFGLFHVVLAGGASPERLLPSTLMGLLLGWVAWRSGSIVPSIILHAIHNCSLLLLANSRDLLARWNLGQTEQEHLPWTLLLPCGIVFALGVALAWYARAHDSKVSDSKVGHDA
ncbi:MAG TPA: hypothetical protein DDW52_18015, partial [Planctomycetaceae bacterium]|nr:hypothetical protein [Planctomycetaceae bacterium]